MPDIDKIALEMERRRGGRLRDGNSPALPQSSELQNGGTETIGGPARSSIIGTDRAWHDGSTNSAELATARMGFREERTANASSVTSQNQNDSVGCVYANPV